jgi:hypothetical protein
VPSPPTCGSGAHEWRSRYGRTTWAQLASIATIVRRRRRGGPGQVYGHLQVVQGCPSASRRRWVMRLAASSAVCASSWAAPSTAPSSVSDARRSALPSRARVRSNTSSASRLRPSICSMRPSASVIATCAVVPVAVSSASSNEPWPAGLPRTIRRSRAGGGRRDGAARAAFGQRPPQVGDGRVPSAIRDPGPGGRHEGFCDPIIPGRVGRQEVGRDAVRGRALVRVAARHRRVQTRPPARAKDRPRSPPGR